MLYYIWFTLNVDYTMHTPETEAEVTAKPGLDASWWTSEELSRWIGYEVDSKWRRNCSGVLDVVSSREYVWLTYDFSIHGTLLLTAEDTEHCSEW